VPSSKQVITLVEGPNKPLKLLVQEIIPGFSDVDTEIMGSLEGMASLTPDKADHESSGNAQDIDVAGLGGNVEDADEARMGGNVEDVDESGMGF
jgi:hypothetical protein